MPVIYDGKKIIPGPFITIRKEVSRNGVGVASQINYVITVKGKIVAYMGSPDSQGNFFTGTGYPNDEVIGADARLAAIQAKQGALINIFCKDFKLFEVQSNNGAAPFKAIVSVRGITFDEGKWYDTCDYTIELDVIKMWFGSVEVCQGGKASTTPPEESWNIEISDEKTNSYRLQHTVSAQAKNSYDENAVRTKKGWEIARDIIKTSAGTTDVVDAPFLGLVTDFYNTTSPLNLSAHNAYNYVRGIQVDEASGKYTVTENWLLYDTSRTSGIPCLEDYTITVRTNEDNRTKVGIEGTITGLEERDNSNQTLIKTRFTNAQNRWAILEGLLYGYANSNANGQNLNTLPLNKSNSKNINAGTITFSREYDNRPTVFAGALSATIQSNITRPTDVFASIVVLGKSAGPVLQSIGTVTAKKLAVSVELVMPSSTIDNPDPTMPNTDSLVYSYYPGGYKDRDEETWSAQTGRYSRQVSWTWV